MLLRARPDAAVDWEECGASMRTIKVDLSLCQGHGRCYGIAPDLFAPTDDDGHAEFVGEPIDPADANDGLGTLAIRSCPEQALSWEQGSPDAAGPGLNEERSPSR
jgi:ferredoxin